MKKYIKSTYRSPHINASTKIYSAQNSELAFKRKEYIYECLDDAPEVPMVDADKYPEAWSQYYHDVYRYKMGCFANGVEAGLFEDDDWDEFKRLWR